MSDATQRTTKPDVLQALAALRTDDGRNLLASGHVQDVLIEWHGDAAHVAVVVDAEWDGRPPSEDELGRIRGAVSCLPGVASVKTIPRSLPGDAHGDGSTPAGPSGAAGQAPDAAAARRRAAAMRPMEPPPRVPPGARLIAVASGKGGVGKSTVSVNLAVALARRGLRTAIVDCDVYGFSVPMLIGLEEAPRIQDRKIVPPRAHGVQVMSMDFFVADNRAVVWRGPMLGKTLRQFMQDVLWDDPEVMVLDLPPGTGDVALDVLNFFPKAGQIVVTTPDPFAARVAERAGRMALEAGHAVLGVVENMSYSTCEGCGRRSHPFGRGGGDAVAAALGVEVLARIPFAETRDGRWDALYPEDSEAGRAYADLALRVLGGERRAGAEAQAETETARRG
ncbi:MAG: Mrp/NBP35 family ATP-binding protein [Clostridia bacterium]|nr:Mrp/NBP35 family ATP-binding protein [Clostridia bacterium]